MHASMIVTYYVIKLFRMGADRHNSILISHFLLIAETTRKATGFKSLPVNCCEISRVIWICQMNFLDKTCKKGLKQEKWTQHHILHIQNSLDTKCLVKLTIFEFLQQINAKRVFPIRKIKKVVNLSFNKKIGFLEQISQKWILSVENRKHEHQHWFLHIRISLSINFELKFTTFIFGPILSKRRISG